MTKEKLMTRAVFFTLFAAAILMVAMGCSDNATQSNDSSGELNLEDEFGGYTAASETPAFGDNVLAETEDEEEEINDALASSPEMQAMVDDPESGIFRFRAVWGQLRYDSSVTDPTDWSGSIEISRGGVLIRRTIRFELAQDYIVPRVDRTLLEWHSITTVHNDGIVADLIVPRPELVLDSIPIIDGVDTTWAVDTLLPDEVTVEFSTGPYSRTFTLAELAGLDTVITLEDSSQIAFTAYQMNLCPKGMLVGQWGRDDEGQGVFRGRWVDRTGRVAGWLQGHYGVNDEGIPVFYGKWINRQGNFEGFLRGTWHPHPSVEASDNAVYHAGGSFEGAIFTDSGTEIGVLKGRYKSSPRFPGGFFQGRWKLYCPSIQPDDNVGEPPLDDGF